MRISSVSFKENNKFLVKSNVSPQNRTELRILSSDNKVANFSNYLAYSKISFKAAMSEHLGQGARYLGDGKTKFTITAPFAKKVTVKIAHDDNYDNPKEISLEKKDDKFESIVSSTHPGDKYLFEIQNHEGKTISLYDPRADYLPNDIEGYRPHSNWAQIVDHKSYKWTDKAWMDARKAASEGKSSWGLNDDTIIESIHIGVLGGFKKAKAEIDKIAEEGVSNTVRVMPVGEFYGKINWGYDEVAKYAVENAYGSPDDFKDFVNHAHDKGIKVVLDVVPNHFGPFGSVAQKLMPIYPPGEPETRWGKMLEFNGEKGKYMKSYMLDMFMNWAVNYHVDGFRFDAMQTMNSDDAIKHFIYELRSHEETKDLTLYPEDMRVSVTMANSNMDKKVSESNWGYDGLTTYDFYKSLFANASNSDKTGYGPNLNVLEQIYQKGVNGTHESSLQFDPNCSEEYKAICRERLKKPLPKGNNYIVNLSNHDEIGNDEGGKRNIVAILSRRLGMGQMFGENWQKALWLTFEMTKRYLKTGKCWSEDEQRAVGVNYPINQGRFDYEFHNAYELNKLMLGAMFMHPSPKEFFMGDSRGEFAPFRFFAEMPPGAMNPKTNRYCIDELSTEKGYMPDESALNESKLRTPEYNANWVNEGTLNFSKDFAKLIKSSNPLRKSDLSRVCTYAHNDKHVLEVKRYDEYNNEVIALMNFSNEQVSGFRAQTTSMQEVKEVLNSNDTKYNSNGQHNNKWKEHIYTDDLIIPPYGIVVFKPVAQA